MLENLKLNIGYTGENIPHIKVLRRLANGFKNENVVAWGEGSFKGLQSESNTDIVVIVIPSYNDDWEEALDECSSSKRAMQKAIEHGAAFFLAFEDNLTVINYTFNSVDKGFELEFSDRCGSITGKSLGLAAQQLNLKSRSSSVSKKSNVNSLKGSTFETDLPLLLP